MQSDVALRLSLAGIKGIRKEGDQLAFFCPFHHNVDTPAARYHLIKHVFYCFGTCNIGMRGKTFWRKINAGELGFIDVSDSEVINIELPDFEDFYHDDISTFLKGAKLYDDSDPISMHSRSKAFIEQRLGPNAKTFGRVRYHKHSDSLIFESKHNYVQKFLQARYKTYGTAHLFTHLDLAPALVLVEGMFDYLKFAQLGVSAAACLGTALTDEKLGDLRNMGVKTLFFAFDNDEAGYAATLRITNTDPLRFEIGKAIKRAIDAGFYCLYVPIPADKKDIGECDYSILLDLLNQAIPIDSLVELEREELYASNPY